MALTDDVLTGILTRAGFDPANLAMWLGIVHAESGGDPAAIHNTWKSDLPNYKGPPGANAGPEFSVGLFQINLGGTSAGRVDWNSGTIAKGPPNLIGQPWQVLLDPIANAQYAHYIGNPSAWSTYTSGAYKAPAGAAAWGVPPGGWGATPNPIQDAISKALASWQSAGEVAMGSVLIGAAVLVLLSQTRAGGDIARKAVSTGKTAGAAAAKAAIL